MTQFDALTYDDLRVGDLKIEGKRVVAEVVRVEKTPATGEIAVLFDDSPEPEVYQHDKPAEGFVRRSQFEGFVAEREQAKRAEQAARDEAESDQARQQAADAAAAAELEAENMARAEAEAAAAAAEAEAAEPDTVLE